MTYAFYAPSVVTMADCACCGCQFEADPCDPETVSCGMCRAGESPGMERLPTDDELTDIHAQLDFGRLPVVVCEEGGANE
jgi:hypothetical protein